MDSRLVIAGIAVVVIIAAFFLMQPNEPTPNPQPPGLTRGPGQPEIMIHTDIEYANVDGESLQLDLYLPKTENPPIILWIHGGAFKAGDKSGNARICERFAAEGFACTSINYRLYPDYTLPEPVFDTKAAVRWIRANANEYGYNATKIGAIGSSAGGYFVSLLGTSGGINELEGSIGVSGYSSRVDAVVDLYGLVDIRTLNDQRNEIGAPLQSTESDALGCLIEECISKASMLSPITHVSSDDPPFLILHGTTDATIPKKQSEDFHAALESAGVSSELILVEGLGHSQQILTLNFDTVLVFFENQLS